VLTAVGLSSNIRLGYVRRRNGIGNILLERPVYSFAPLDRWAYSEMGKRENFWYM
jgi:hypothetical protein